MHARPAGISFQLLGPMIAWSGDEPRELGTPQQRAVLAMLLLHQGRPVPALTIAEGVWADEAPPRAYGAVRTYVSRLRTALEPGRRPGAPGSALVSEHGGYALRLPDAAVDSLLFDQETANTHDQDDPRTAYERLTRAVGRWQGTALAGVPGPYAQRQRDRLTEAKITAQETLHEHALALGLHTRSLPELCALTAEFPLRERLHELLMLALYRSGRQADALSRYARARRLLDRELGVPPTQRLTALYQRILTADPALGLGPAPGPASDLASDFAGAPGPGAVRPAPRPAPGRTGGPRHLPPGPVDFTGRAAAVAGIHAFLTGTAGNTDSPGPRAAVLTGTGGVGKTTVAFHVAHALAPRFPDGLLHADLGAGSTPADPASVLADFLTALGVPPDDIPLDLDQRAALYRTVLADRRMLLVLDNALDTEQLRPLLPGTAGAAVLITTRARQLTIPGAHRVELDVPPEPEALTLLTAIIGAARVDAEPEAARSLVASCGRLPLAVRIIGSRLAAHPRRELAWLAGRLRRRSALLDELRTDGLAVEPAFRLGYEALAPEPARAFRVLSLLDAPDLPLPVAAALLGLDEYAAEHLAETLVDAGMIESHGPGRYRFHDLLRLYARGRAEEADSAAERHAALTRVQDLLLASVARAADAVITGELPAGWLMVGDHPGLSFSGVAEAREWFGAEHTLLTSVAEQSLNAAGSPRKALDLLAVIAVGGFFQGRAHYSEVSRLTSLCVARGRSHGDAECVARALHTRAWLSFTVRRFGDAEADLRAALDYAEECGDALRHHLSGVLLALVLWATGRADEAVRAVRRAEAYAGDPADPDSPASVARFVARLHVALGSELPDLAVLTPVMRSVDATGGSLATAVGLQRLGQRLDRPAPAPGRED
ncbi:AfsR/SARP family transcriptional regulator [Streptomyces jumonjinensis]|uniref:AfsR/SARP family transcriptional regulator n=1 Tax=Streptomyces jumonjinensis TaxID=1945 RepID=UPI0037A5D2FE